MARIELDIFSGRPNPRWDLNAAQEAELNRQLARLSPSSAKVSVPDLGYRGFIIRNDHELRIYRGHVFAGAAEKVCWAGADRQIERWLLETATDVLGEELYGGVLQLLKD